jgi:diamine N-acetyltransferase
MTLLKNDIARLRPLEPEDLDMLYEWENDPSMWTIGTTVSPYSRYTLKKYIAQSHRSIYETRQLRLMIETDGVSAGLVDMYDFDPHHRKAAVGILLDLSLRGKGVATGALSLLVDYAFSFLKLHQLYAYIPVDNDPSKALFKRCGFSVPVVLTDWIVAGECFSDVLLVQRINKKNDRGRLFEPVE